MNLQSQAGGEPSASIHSASCADRAGSSRAAAPVAPLRKAGERMIAPDLASLAANEFTGVLVVLATGEDELQLIARGERGQVSGRKRRCSPLDGTLHIHNFVHLGGNGRSGRSPLVSSSTCSRAASSRRISGISSRSCSMGSPPVISTRPPVGERREPRSNLIFGHLVAAAEGVLGVTPGAAQIASGQAHKDAWQPGKGALTL